MKTSVNSESGFVKLALIFGCVIILLFYMGAQGIYTAIKNRNPAVMSCEQFANNKPKAAWLSITNCVLDLNDACYATLKYKGAELPTELYIPVRSASAKEPGKEARDNIVLMTRDPALMKTIYEMEKIPNEKEFKEWLARNADRLLVRRDVKGLVQFGVELKTEERRKLASLQDNLAKDFIILDEGKRPEFKQAIGFLALGAMLVVISIFVIKRSVQEPEPAEIY
jgi:hypothetical protein